MQVQIENLIREALPDADVEVHPNGPGHYVLKVVSAEFEGKNRLARQRLVFRAIQPLMAGNMAPVHAIDRMITETK